MKRIIFILSLVSGSLINSAFCEIPQILLDKTSKIEFNNALYFADVDNKYSVYQVSTPDFLTNFKPLPKDPKTYINSADVFWLRFDIVNQEEMDLYWIFEFNHWSYLNFYSKLFSRNRLFRQ